MPLSDLLTHFETCHCGAVLALFALLLIVAFTIGQALGGPREIVVLVDPRRGDVDR